MLRAFMKYIIADTCNWFVDGRTSCPQELTKNTKKAKNAQYENRSVLNILSHVLRIGIFVWEWKGAENLNIVY